MAEIMEQLNIPHPDEVEKKFNEVIIDLKSGREFPQDSARDVLNGMVECSDLLGDDAFKNQIAELRDLLEKLGFKDENTDDDTPSASATSIPNLLKSLVKIGSGLLTLYRTGDAILRFPDNAEKVKSYCSKYQPGGTNTQKIQRPVVVIGASYNEHRDFVNGSTVQCENIDLTRVKEFRVTSNRITKKSTNSP